MLIGLVFIFASRQYADTHPLIPLIGISYFSLCAVYTLETVQSFLYAYNRFAFGSIGSLLQKIFMAAAGGAAVVGGLQLFEIVEFSTMAAWMVALCMCVGLWVIVAKLPQETLWKARESGARLIKEAFPLFMAGIFASLCFKVDSVLLGHMTTHAETGTYAAAYRFFEITNVLPAVCIAVAQPVLARSVLSGTLEATFWKFAKIMILFASGVMAALQVVPLAFPYVLHNPHYEHAGPLLRLLSLAIIPWFLNYLLMTVLTIVNKQKEIALISFCGLVFNILANLLVIPYWRASGSAIITFASEVVVFVLCFVVLKRSALK